MSQKYKHKSICVLLLLFFTFPVICMEVDQSDQEPHQRSNRKRKRSASEPKEASKKQKRELDRDDLLYLWLHKKASKCKWKKNGNLSNASLAFLLECMPIDKRQLIAEEVYVDQIDPIFISKLLCIRDTKQPKKIWTHRTPPHIEYGNNSAFLKCDNPCVCPSKDEFHISGPSDIYEEEKHHLRAPLYHAWRYVQKRSRENKLPLPTLLLKETNGDLVTVHDKEVHRWPVGQEFEQNKELFVKELNLQEVLLLKHMQITQDRLDIEKEKLHSSARENIEQLKKQAESIPRTLRAIKRAHEKEEAERENES